MIGTHINGWWHVETTTGSQVILNPCPSELLAMQTAWYMVASMAVNEHGCTVRILSPNNEQQLLPVFLPGQLSCAVCDERIMDERATAEYELSIAAL